MSSQRGNGTNREWASASSRLQRRDFELLDDLKSLVEQRTNIARENRRVRANAKSKLRRDACAACRAINSSTPDQLPREPHSGENLPRPAPSDQKRIKATDHENDDGPRESPPDAREASVQPRGGCRTAPGRSPTLPTPGSRAYAGNHQQ